MAPSGEWSGRADGKAEVGGSRPPRAPLLPAGRGGSPDRGHVPVGFGADDAAATPSQPYPSGDLHLGNVDELVDGDAHLTLAGRWQPSPASLRVEQGDRRSTLVPNMGDLDVVGVRQVVTFMHTTGVPVARSTTGCPSTSLWTRTWTR